MKYVVECRHRGDVYPLTYTEAETPQQARSKLESAMLRRQALIHPMANLVVVLVDEPPANEDR